MNKWSGGRGQNKGSSGSSSAASNARVSRERGIPPKSKNQGGSVQSLTPASNCDDDIKTWLNELKQQTEKDEYNDKAFDKKPNGNSESAQLSVILKKICNNIESRSKYQRGLLSKVETLYSKLQEACKNLEADASRGTPPLAVHGAGARKKESPDESKLSAAIVNAEKLIENVSSKRDTQTINKKLEKGKQEKHTKEAVQKAEHQWKSKFSDVIDWLNKLVKQISDSNFDENGFKKGKIVEGSHEEVNKCNTIILDCCRKLKNENDSKMSANKEVTLLLKEIKDWSNVKTINEAKEDCQDPIIKEFRGSRLQVHKRKKEFKSAKQEVDCLTKELKSWVQLKAIDGEIDSDCELARLIRSNRSAIFEKKKELQSEKEKKEDTRKLTKNQEQAIKDILTIIDKDKNTSGKVDIANYLDKIKQHVSVSRENLDQIEIEVHSLLEEINAWDDTTPLKKATGNACKEVEALRESRLKLHKRKLDLKSGHDKEDVARKEKQSQDQMIKEMWAMIRPTSGKVNSGADEIGKALAGIKKYVSDSQIRLSEFNDIRSEVTLLLEEISAWDDTTPLKKAKGNACKEVEALRESRLKLRDLKSGHDKKDAAQKEKQSQDQVIIEIWTMIGSTSVKVNSGGDDIGKLLKEIKKYVSDAQIRQVELNDIETEVNFLLEEIKRWDNTKPLNKVNNNQCKVMIALGESRSKLRERILELKSGQHDKEELARNEKQSQEQVIQEILTIIGSTSGKVTSGGDGNKTVLTEIKTYVSDSQGRLAELNEIEKRVFEVEAKGNMLFSDLSGRHHSKSDEQRSPVDTCKSIIKVLDSCKTETETLVEIVSRLEVDLNIDRKSGSVKSDSVSNRCKAIKETVEKRKQMFDEMQSMLDKSTNSLTLSYSELLDEPYLFLEPRSNADSIRRKVPEWLHGHAALIDRIRACTKENKTSFQLRYVRKEDYNDLQDQMRTLHEEMRQLREDKESAYNRLSKVAGARLTDNNPNIADLSDPNRPTKIAEQYSELYDTPWTDAYEILKDKDQENTDFLLKIIVDCYEICGKISMNHQRNLKNAVCYPANNIEDGQSSEQKKGKTESPVSFSAVQSKALSELRKQTADISVVNVISQIELEKKDWFVPEKLRSYTTRCIELCWLMHVQTPPVVIDRSAKPGSKFDTNRYKQYTKAGKKIDFVVWPVLLLEEGGAILCKGVAQGK